MQVLRSSLAVFLGLALTSVACGGSSDAPPQRGGSAGGSSDAPPQRETSAGGPCTITLSGAVTGSVSCTVAVLHDGQKDVTAFGLTVQQSTPGGGADVRIAGPAKTGTLTDANCLECTIFAFATAGNPPPTWAMQLKPRKQGSFSLTIDSLGAGSNGPNGGVAYPSPHGSATAVLPADQGTGATGTVNLSAKF